jgi:hypothetical protein
MVNKLNEEVKLALDYSRAVEEALECLVVELSSSGVIDADKLFDRMKWISAVRRDLPSTAAIRVHLHRITENFSRSVDRNTGPPPIAEDPKP